MSVRPCLVYLLLAACGGSADSVGMRDAAGPLLPDTATVDGVLVMRHGADAFARAPQWSIDPEPQLIIDGGEEHDLSTVYNEVTLLPDGRAVVLRSLNVTPNGAAAGPRAAPGKW